MKRKIYNQLSKWKNISIEVKSSQRYTLTSLRKFTAKYGEYITDPIVIHSADFAMKDVMTFLPLYMAPLL